MRNVLGDGRALGVRLRYVEEPRPLGTGGAVKYAERLLDERFLMLNGDVLTDLDLTAQIAAAREQRARAATLALIAASRTRGLRARAPDADEARHRVPGEAEPPTRSTPT